MTEDESTDNERDAGAEPDAGVWVLPEEPRPIRLMNTIWADRHGVHDGLTTCDDLARWLLATGLVSNRVAITDDDLDRYRHLRDALRRLAAFVCSDDRPAAASAITSPGDAIDAVNQAARHTPLPAQLQLSNRTLTRDRTPLGPPINLALARLATEAIELVTDDNAPRLRACHAPRCVLYFVKDHPRREWCTPGCGNRARAARHYRRHRDDPPRQKTRPQPGPPRV